MKNDNEKQFKDFLELCKRLLSLAEWLNDKKQIDSIGFIDLELIYKNFFDEYMKK